MGVTILHLSDLHMGPGELRDEDQKQSIPGAERSRLPQRLAHYLKALPNTPDYAVITGDITIRGEREGIREFRDWIFEGIKDQVLPNESRIMIVPGNHDVQWGIEEMPGWHRERYKAFWEILCTAFPHAYVPDCDPALDAKQPAIDISQGSLIGGLKCELEHGSAKVVSSYPFLLDLERHILIFAFNSTLACGVYLKQNPKIVNPLGNLAELHAGEDIGRTLRQVHDAYLESLLVDAGLVGDQQLNYFSQLMSRLRSELGTEYAKLTKIALLHHHISHLWGQQLETKQFESVVDTAQLKQRLVEFEFDMVLHGHKHTNHVALDGSIIPISSKQPFAPLCIVAGGTTGGYPRLGDRQTFKLITLEEEQGPRTTASIIEVPLLDEDPQHVIEKESTIYQVPISSRLPELHDLSEVKQRLDEILRDECAPELAKSNDVIHMSPESQLPPADPDLVGEASRYTFYCIADRQDEKVFYDIILATDGLGFKQRARIHWMLTDIKGLAEREGLKCRVILLIGNFEGTHFYRGLVQGEVSESVKELKNWFAPAVGSGFLEIRCKHFSQEEVEQITRSATKVI